MKILFLFLTLLLSSSVFAQQASTSAFQLQAEVDTIAAHIPNLENKAPDAIMQFKFNRPYPLQFEAHAPTLKGGDRLNPNWLNWIPPSCFSHWPARPQARGIDSWIVFIEKSSLLPQGWFVMYPGGDYLDRELSPRGWVEEVKTGRHYIYRIWLDYSVISGQRSVPTHSSL